MTLTRLKDKDGNLLLDYDQIAPVAPADDYIEVENRLLDGTPHLQTIGQPLQSFSFDFYCDGAEKETLDDIAHRKEPVRLERHGKYYDSVIRGSIEWDTVAPGRTVELVDYRGTIEILVTEAGDL